MTKEKREQIRQRLKELEDASGRLTAETVVEDAADPNSPLHDQFQWDDSRAALQYRLDQARALITSVRIVQRTDKTTVSAVYYVRDPSAGPKEQGYVSVGTLRSDEELAREAIVAEFSRVADLLRRAKALAAVLSLDDRVAALLTDVVELRQVVMDQPEAMM